MRPKIAKRWLSAPVLAALLWSCGSAWAMQPDRQGPASAERRGPGPRQDRMEHVPEREQRVWDRQEDRGDQPRPQRARDRRADDRQPQERARNERPRERGGIEDHGRQPGARQDLERRGGPDLRGPRGEDQRGRFEGGPRQGRDHQPEGRQGRPEGRPEGRHRPEQGAPRGPERGHEMRREGRGQFGPDAGPQRGRGSQSRAGREGFGPGPQDGPRGEGSMKPQPRNNEREQFRISPDRARFGPGHGGRREHARPHRGGPGVSGPRDEGPRPPMGPRGRQGPDGPPPHGGPSRGEMFDAPRDGFGRGAHQNMEWAPRRPAGPQERPGRGSQPL